MRWRIYYDDGATYSDEDGPVELAPCDGVIAIAQADATVGREILHAKHFYVWDGGRWLPVGDQSAPGDGHWGLFDYLRRPGWRKLVAGRTVRHEVYSRVYQRAMTDPDLPPKSARLPLEAPRRG